MHSGVVIRTNTGEGKGEVMISSIISDQIDMDFEKALKTARNHFEYVEIHSAWNKTVEDFDDSDVREIESLLHKYRMKVSCLSTTLFLMCPLYTEVEMLEPFSDTFLVYTGGMDEHYDMLRKCTELSRRLKTAHIRVFPFRKEPGVHESLNEQLTAMEDRFVKAVDIAESQGCALLIENCPHSYLPQGDMTFQLASRIGRRGFALLYDIGNSFKSKFTAGGDEQGRTGVIEEYERIKELVRHFHFKDYGWRDERLGHAALGEGDVGYEGIYARIVASQIDACISLEPEVDGDGVKRSIEYFMNMQEQTS
jgi:sugar phosphate isomerase/epimerase